MMIPNNYWINIAQNGIHYAEVTLSEMLPKDAKEKYQMFCKKFPESEGYKLVLYYTICNAEVIN